MDTCPETDPMSCCQAPACVEWSDVNRRCGSGRGERGRESPRRDRHGPLGWCELSMHASVASSGVRTVRSTDTETPPRHGRCSCRLARKRRRSCASILKAPRDIRRAFCCASATRAYWHDGMIAILGDSCDLRRRWRAHKPFVTRHGSRYRPAAVCVELAVEAHLDRTVLPLPPPTHDHAVE